MAGLLFTLSGVLNDLTSVTTNTVNSLTSGTPPASALAACSQIAKGTAETQIWPSAITNVDYAQATQHYWNAANGELIPACAVFPTNAEEVSAIIKALLQYEDVNFAMKSGGHNPNVGFSAVAGGALISFNKLASTTYFPQTTTADVGPGARWEEVITALESYNVAVVGGRIGDVGVGGLLLGGGLSFLSPQYGLPADSVVNYEVVLSNATIVNANSMANPDLYWALKGGGNQFGIVTKFTMKTFPIGQASLGWSSNLCCDATSTDVMISATQDFCENYPDPRAYAIVTGELIADSLVETFFLFFFYDGPGPPAGVFDKFDAASGSIIVDTTKTRSYSDLLTGNNAYASQYGFRYLIRGVTLPILPSTDGIELLEYSYESWRTYITSQGLLGVLTPGFIYSLAYQPVPYLVANASATINPLGNPLGLSPLQGDRLYIGYDISWLTVAGDDTAYSLAKGITNILDDYAQAKFAGVKNTHYVSGDVMQEEYNPLNYNEAMFDQSPLQTYGTATYARLKGIQKAYDPIGFFPSRTGGFVFT